MRISIALALGVSVLLAASPASAEVHLTIRNGRVTLVAKDATVRQILTEWARVGQTKIVNVERIPGGPMELQFTDVPEAEALDILLRSVSGYMAAPRPVAVVDLSQYDRIMVMPTVAAAPRPSPPATSASRQPGAFIPSITNEDDDGTTPRVVLPPNGPIFQTFQQPQVGQVNPQVITPGTPTSIGPNGPNAPNGLNGFLQQLGQSPSIPTVQQPAPGFPGATILGTSRPGMIIQPTVQTPGQVPAGGGQPAQRSPDN